MYVAVLAIILGQALLFRQALLIVYAGAVGIAMFAFVRVYEEPLLERRYGAAYGACRNAVPGWLPRLTPWRGE